MYDPEALYQDADIEMAELAARAREAAGPVAVPVRAADLKAGDETQENGRVANVDVLDDGVLLDFKWLGPWADDPEAGECGCWHPDDVFYVTNREAQQEGTCAACVSGDAAGHTHRRFDGSPVPDPIERTQ
jgi:hypothetical protein